MNGIAAPLARRRGEPLLALALIVTSWIGVRAFAWQGVAGDGMQMLMTRGFSPAVARARVPTSLPGGRFTPWRQADVGSQGERPEGGVPVGAPVYWVQDSRGRGLGPHMLAAGMPRRAAGEAGLPGWTLRPGTTDTSGLGVRRGGRTESPGGNAAPFPVAPTPRESAHRWSGDAWLLARSGTGPALVGGPAPATYGASQAGAILRYALAPSSRFHPSAYARVSSALSGVDEAEAALGLSARPLRTVPVIALGELRATRSAGRLRLRPAAMLVTQVPPLALPLGLRGEIYAQGGYVAGRGATPFADGQFTFDHALTRIAGHPLRIGGGAWGGAQRGAARLDLGPSARVDLRIGSRIFARLALDYRLRVAGDAEPGSGPALSASAGF